MQATTGGQLVAAPDALIAAKEAITAAEPGGSPPVAVGLNPGQLVARRWRLLARIGRGAFGDIFVTEWDAAEAAAAALSPGADPSAIAHAAAAAAEHGGRRFAIKIEKLALPAVVEPTADGDPVAHAAAVAEAAAAAAARAVLKLEAVILTKLQKYPCVVVSSSTVATWSSVLLIS